MTVPIALMSCSLPRIKLGLCQHYKNQYNQKYSGPFLLLIILVTKKCRKMVAKDCRKRPGSARINLIAKQQ